MTVNIRENVVIIFVFVAFGLIVSRLFYWQIIKGSQLQAAAENQYYRTIVKEGSRGIIYTADNFPLVTNREVYRLFAQPHLLKISPEQATSQLSQILLDYELAKLDSEEKRAELTTELSAAVKQNLLDKLSNPKSRWVSLYSDLPLEIKDQIEALAIFGLGFDAYEKRYYPEASMAAHVTGFVGKNEKGEDVGYFGIEGALEKELQARSTRSTVFTDALGLELVNKAQQSRPIDGRDVTITIRRDVQHLIEQELTKGLEKYGAQSGEIIVMEPATGKILGMAAQPSYNQAEFFKFPAEYYKNPSLADLYEPGSTFKILTVAAGIDTGKITPSTLCTKCAGPRKFGQFTIKTWNDVYHPNISVEEGLAKSDNTAMIFIAELLGADDFQRYLKQFGIGSAIGIELQEDTNSPFPQRWGSVELATTAFGQGISTNSMQLLRAVAAVANNGKMMQPIIVEKVTDKNTGEEIITPIKVDRQVVSSETAKQVTQMMITAAQGGEAQWTASKTHTIAGKTGTSQVAIGGEYSADKTIASFIGFAPPENPKFIMLIKLNEPQSSPWAAETAAPMWYAIADKLYLLLNIPPDR